MYLLFTFRYLHGKFHGRNSSGDAGEWPPSPCRLFGALVAQAYQWGAPPESAVAGLDYLTGLGAPWIGTAESTPLLEYTGYVISHNSDVFPAAEDRSKSNLEKSHYPRLLLGTPMVHFAFHVGDGAQAQSHLEALQELTSSIGYLGTGLDAVMASCAITDTLPESPDTWFPDPYGSLAIQVPTAKTRASMVARHIHKCGNTRGYQGIDPPRLVAQTVGYRRTQDEMDQSPLVLKLDRAFSTLTECPKVTGMVRDALHRVALSEGRDATFIAQILGHNEDGSPAKSALGEVAANLVIQPMPSKMGAGFDRIEDIRRVLITARPGLMHIVRWAKRVLPRECLRDKDTHQSVAMMERVPETDAVAGAYCGESTQWASVTPVCLPWQRAKADLTQTFYEAVVQAGHDPTGMTVEVSQRGFLRGVGHVMDYGVRKTLRGSMRCHVRITFQTPRKGPFSFGNGRFQGSGLFIGA